MKAQIFSSFYSVIFITIIVSFLVILNSVIMDWESNNLLLVESKSLNSVFNYLTNFDNYNFYYNNSVVFNLSINEFVNLSSDDYFVTFNNSYNLPFVSFENVNGLVIVKNGEVWILS